MALTGAGTETDPYRIYTAADIADIANYTTTVLPGTMPYFLQMNDISFAEYGNYTMLWPNQVIRQYDGGGFKISDVTISHPDSHKVALLGTIGTLKNLWLHNIQVSALMYAACGCIRADIISNVLLTESSVTTTLDVCDATIAPYGYGTSDYVISAGLACAAGDSNYILENLIAYKVTVTSKDAVVGGLIGVCSTDMHKCAIADCTITNGNSLEAYSNSPLTGGLAGVGPGVGYYGSFYNCYVIRTKLYHNTSSYGYMGAIVAEDAAIFGSGPCEFVNCYIADNLVSGATASADVASVASTRVVQHCYCYSQYNSPFLFQATTRLALQTLSTFYAYDFGNIWAMDIKNDGFPHFIDQVFFPKAPVLSLVLSNNDPLISWDPLSY